MKNARFFLIFGAAIIAVGSSIFFLSEFDTSSSYTLENSNSTCVDCHGMMSGLSPLHKQLECISCHKGNNMAGDVDSAHYKMIKVPGNLADAQETCGICHVDAIKHITSSLMTSNSGIIAIDKYIFGEEASPNTVQHVDSTNHSMADQHLRALCLRCHLGSDKKIYGPITQESRGGGCNACHLNYTETAANQLEDYLASGNLPSVHPSLDLNISDNHCFGCHSRSGRISTNYLGYHETLLSKDELVDATGYWQIDDGRVFKQVEEDIHHTRGLSCIDCHGYDDVMGDGKTYLHEEDAVKISCEDCHSQNLNYQTISETNFIQQRIVKIRNFEHIDRPVLITKKDSSVINNAFINQEGEAKLIGKLTGKEFDLLAPSSSCTKEYGHNSLTCTSCHTQWAPQCIGCHVEYETNSKGYDLLEKREMDGTWVEYAGSFLFGPPTLGVREVGDQKKIEPAIPGMIMTLDKESFSSHAMPVDTNFYRLFAPASPHTIGAKGRDCKSCHNNPLALGYGRGSLSLEENENQWQWSFTSEYENLDDGLPADAWTGFMKERDGIVSTRTNFRPFSIEEQKLILRVGACLTCHEGGSPEMRNSINTDFEKYLRQVSEQCIIVYK